MPAVTGKSHLMKDYTEWDQGAAPRGSTGRKRKAGKEVKARPLGKGTCCLLQLLSEVGRRAEVWEPAGKEQLFLGVAALLCSYGAPTGIHHLLANQAARTKLLSCPHHVAASLNVPRAGCHGLCALCNTGIKKEKCNPQNCMHTCSYREVFVSDGLCGKSAGQAMNVLKC